MDADVRKNEHVACHGVRMHCSHIRSDSNMEIQKQKRHLRQDCRHIPGHHARFLQLSEYEEKMEVFSSYPADLDDILVHGLMHSMGCSISE